MKISKTSNNNKFKVLNRRRYSCGQLQHNSCKIWYSIPEWPNASWWSK